MCIFDNCKKIPIFNIPTEIKGLYCFDHKSNDMIDVIHKRCFEENCIKIPVFNLPLIQHSYYYTII
jgi:hypothetical protein